jgi:hypothetical protein
LRRLLEEAMANSQSPLQLHRRAVVLGLVAAGAAGALAATTGIGEAAPALPASPLRDNSSLVTDALFRPGEDDAKVESVYWRRCWINRWGRRVCEYGPRRRVCWWRHGRRVCAWR